MMTKTSPQQVFTPRSAEVNAEMYIPRPDLEERLRQALNGSLHILIHGESGCGKSWLYKQVFSSIDAFYVPVNLALASNMNSIAKALQNSVDRHGEAEKTGYKETKSAELNTIVAKGSLEHEGEFEIGEMEPFEKCLAHCRKKSGNRLALVVLDNLEAIFSNATLMQELGNLITLLDDEIYAKYKVRMVIVGVPSEVREYFSKTLNRNTIANRLYEIPEVSSLKPAQTFDFAARGFAQQLGYFCEENEFEPIVNHVHWVTLGIPQRLHEYCLELAFLAERNNHTLALRMCDEADQNWLSTDLSNDFSTIQLVMNERETRVGRRNQVLFALGRIGETEFRNPDVERMVKTEFPQSTTNSAINVSQILSDLASRSNPIIKRSSSKTDAYIFTDPRFRMCIRAMLRRDAKTEQVSHFDIKDL